MNAEDLIRRGDHASQLLQDSVLNEAIENIVQDCIKRWRDSPARDAEGRERIWQHLKHADAVKAELERFVAEGKMAKAKIDGINKSRADEKRFKEEMAARLGISVDQIIDD